MNNQPINRDIMLNIYKNGTYYNPAKKHYGSDATNIVCDRCYKNNLDICIGWLTYDLCLQCIQSINKEITGSKLPEIVEIVKIKKPDPLLKMRQSQFRESDGVKTFMMQSQFRKN